MFGKDESPEIRLRKKFWKDLQDDRTLMLGLGFGSRKPIHHLGGTASVRAEDVCTATPLQEQCRRGSDAGGRGGCT